MVTTLLEKKELPVVFNCAGPFDPVYTPFSRTETGRPFPDTLSLEDRVKRV